MNLEVAPALTADPLPAEDTPAPAAAAAAEPPLTVIEPRHRWGFVDVNELWRYHELLGFLVWRDIKVRYKQTVLGAAWAVLQPLATMVVFTLFLRDTLRDKGPDAAPYPLFVYCGMLLWTCFASAIASTSNSVVASQNMVTKIYFPRLLIPLGAIGAVIVDLIIGLTFLLLLMTGYAVTGYPISIGWNILYAPFLILALGMLATGLGTMLAALTVKYRDFRHVVPFLIQLWLFATPSIFVQEGFLFGTRGQLVLRLNPVHGLIVNFRAVVLNQPMDTGALGMALCLSLILLVFGCLYFRRVESEFADII